VRQERLCWRGEKGREERRREEEKNGSVFAKKFRKVLAAEISEVSDGELSITIGAHTLEGFPTRDFGLQVFFQTDRVCFDRSFDQSSRCVSDCLGREKEKRRKDKPSTTIAMMAALKTVKFAFRCLIVADFAL